jgi:hypothetical protein
MNGETATEEKAPQTSSRGGRFVRPDPGVPGSPFGWCARRAASWHDGFGRMTDGEIALLMRIGTNDRTWQCPFCGAPFTSIANFALHKDACRKRPAR